MRAARKTFPFKCENIQYIFYHDIYSNVRKGSISLYIHSYYRYDVCAVIRAAKMYLYTNILAAKTKYL